MLITLTVPPTAQGFLASVPRDLSIKPDSRARMERRWRAKTTPHHPDLQRAAVLRAVCRRYCYTVEDVADHTGLARDLAAGILERLASEGLIRKASRPVPCSETRETLFTPRD
jgi:hypothetical protein